MKALTFHLTAICLSLLLPAGVLIFAPEHAGAQVAEVWLQRYNGPSNGSDQPTAIATDGSGNVFVTGYSMGVAWDYATIKYSASGVALWTNRYNGAAGSNDQAFDLAVDTNGNAIVTGYSFQSGTSYKYVTIKYSNTGVPAWTNWYSVGVKSATATAVTIDIIGNVFVTGGSLDVGWDYATIAYSATGLSLWTNRYHQLNFLTATDVAVDRNGNVFVTGYDNYAAGGARSYVTVGYTGSGLPMWTNSYGSLGSATALGVTSNGNVIVTGWQGTLAYSGSGLPLWTNKNVLGAAMAVGGDGNIYVASGYDTIAFSSAGVILWTNRYTGPAYGNRQVAAVAVDKGGSAYVTGSATGVSGNLDIVTIKYSSAGQLLWMGRYNGPANGDDKPLSRSSIAIGPDDAVYVTGASDGDFSTNTVYDYVTIKYVSTPTISPLQIRRIASGVELSWANEALGLQSAPAATGLFTNIPNATTPFTNAITDQQRFFRLKAN